MLQIRCQCKVVLPGVLRQELRVWEGKLSDPRERARCRSAPDFPSASGKPKGVRVEAKVMAWRAIVWFRRTLLRREDMTRYAPLAGSPDIELNAAGTEAKMIGGGPIRTEARPRARERSRHPLVLAGVVIVLLVVYSGWNWRPHPPHPPREFYGPPTLPPHLRHDGPVPGPAAVCAHRSLRKYIGS